MTTTTSLIDMLNEHLASDQLQLPVFSRVALEVQQILSGDDVDVRVLSAKISADQVLASRVLRKANSAFFSGLKQVSTIEESIMRVGIREVMNLVLMTTQQQQYACANRFLNPYVGKL